MAKYTICNVESGEIVASGECQDECITNIPVLPGNMIVEGTYSAYSHYFINGQPIAYTESEALAKRNRPEQRSQWSNTTKTWEDLRTLDQHKNDKWQSVKSFRNSDETAGFTWNGFLFDSDAKSQSRIQGAAQLATLALMNNQPFSIDWTLADNTIWALSAQDMLDVGVAMGVHIQAQHAKARLKRGEIALATTPEEVAAITW